MKIIKYIKANIGFTLATGFLLLMIFNPSAKALVLRGLMNVGLFQPDVKTDKPRQILPAGLVFADSKGRRVEVSALKGKVLFINFWATWCPPCIAEMPSINKLHSLFKDEDDVVFLMVDVDNSLQRSLAFMEKKKYSLPVHTPISTIPPSLFDGSIPATLIVDKAGQIVFQHSGGADFSNQEFVQFMQALAR